MREIKELLVSKINELIDNGTVDRVIGWKAGEFCYDVSPAIFTKENLDELVYNSFCGANQSKFLVGAATMDVPFRAPNAPEPPQPKKILALLKPCDCYSYNQLQTEHRLDAEKVYALGIPCTGMIGVNKIKAKGITGILGIEEEGDTIKVKTLYGDEECKKSEVLLERCMVCKGKNHVAGDELLIPDEEAPEVPVSADRMAEVAKLEAMTEQERFDFWRSQLSKCIRCNACRNACPACTCRTCVFDKPKSGVAAKVNNTDFEENMFHVIRAFHVAGRCTDCGECSRVCPQNIPLHLLNRKFIKDIDTFYGDFQAGTEVGVRGPLISYTKEDCEPSIVMERGN